MKLSGATGSGYRFPSYSNSGERELPFNNSYNPLTTGSANGNESPTRPFLSKYFCQCCYNSSTGRSKWVAGGERTAIDVEF